MLTQFYWKVWHNKSSNIETDLYQNASKIWKSYTLHNNTADSSYWIDKDHIQSNGWKLSHKLTIEIVDNILKTFPNGANSELNALERLQEILENTPLVSEEISSYDVGPAASGWAFITADHYKLSYPDPEILLKTLSTFTLSEHIDH